MFQSFEKQSSPEFAALRMALFRDEMRERGLDGFLVPRADAHQGEYVAEHDARLAWLTGFTGSAGFAAVLQDRAGVFVDGRYRLQVKEQVDLKLFTPVDWPENKLGPWLVAALPRGGVVGFDPWLHTVAEIEALREAVKDKGINLKPVENVVDAVWGGQPPPPAGRLFAWPEDLAGESSEARRTRLSAELAEAGQEAAVITLPDSIMWLLNVRGEDIPRVPVAHGFAILHKDARVTFFTRASPEPDVELDEGVTLALPDDFALALKGLSGKVRLDRQSAPLAIFDLLAGADVVFDRDPCVLPKAKKTPAEIAATTAAHDRDAVAMVEFLAWLDRELPKGELTEIAVVSALEGFRRASNALQDISFDTILGSGPNGAVIHYRVTRESDRLIGYGELVVIDSGAQYIDGTTDITRTVVRGTASDEAKAAFTRVLQGMIGVSRLRFPRGVTGAHIDAVARAPLWMAGQDYDHGTGHGVGVYLSVHEGPARISRLSDVALEPGMILSNEPGYYRDGAFGIRIENLIVVEEAAALPGGDPHRKQLGFKTLTHVPIDRRLIVTEMLSPGERDWLNRYHADCRARVAGKLSPEAEAWLVKMTEPL
jgi:Xaa-Pro aminopeptidase